ncbi:MAG: ABC transporter ATP-binding protein, partial [Myxococcota bacterium]|nr:ABC transporter ATP-binding protein [Myxococcota bacterium]
VQEGLKQMFDATTRVVDGVVEWERPEAHMWIPRIVEAFPPQLFESISVRKPTLADAFYHLTGHSLVGEDQD